MGGMLSAFQAAYAPPSGGSVNASMPLMPACCTVSVKRARSVLWAQWVRVLGALDDGGVVVVGLDVQLVDVAKIAEGQDVAGERGVGGAEGFVGDDEQVNHGGLVWMGIGSLKTAGRVQLRWGVALRDGVAAPQAGKL